MREMTAACRGCREASLNTLHNTNAKNQEAKLLAEANAIVAPIMGASMPMPMLAGVR
jgi:hypothetical protein